MYVLFVVTFLIISALFPEIFFCVLSFLRLIFCQRSLQLVLNTGIQCSFSIGKGGVTSGRGKLGVLCTSLWASSSLKLAIMPQAQALP